MGLAGLAQSVAVSARIILIKRSPFRCEPEKRWTMFLILSYTSVYTRCISENEHTRGGQGAYKKAIEGLEGLLVQYQRALTGTGTGKGEYEPTYVGQVRRSK
jgi:hypothetical protein